jgi:hypothetical protein
MSTVPETPGTTAFVIHSPGETEFEEFASADFLANGTYITASNQLVVSGIPESAVPEPSTWALMLLGLAAIGWGMRHQRQQPQVRFAF